MEELKLVLLSSASGGSGEIKFFNFRFGKILKFQQIRFLKKFSWKFYFFWQSFLLKMHKHLFVHRKIFKNFFPQKLIGKYLGYLKKIG